MSVPILAESSPEKSKSQSAALTGHPLVRGSLRSDLFVILFLVLLNFLVFARTIGGYFLADDFVHVAYLHQVFDGHPEMLWQNFFSNWMQAQGTQFYRPMISLTLALDYLVFGPFAAGFHLSNILYQCAACLFLFFAVRRLLCHGDHQAAWLTALATAVLFAVYPLHAEVVGWIIGRVDSVCVAFYLLAFWLFLRARQTLSPRCAALAATAYVCSLLSKEMAVTLPPVLFLYCFINGWGKTPLASSIRQALKSTLPFWVILFLYLAVRTMALGTAAGGYNGSIGEGLSSSVFKRFFLDRSFHHVLFPFNAELFTPADKWLRNTRLVYQLIVTCFLARIACTALAKIALWRLRKPRVHFPPWRMDGKNAADTLQNTASAGAGVPSPPGRAWPASAMASESVCAGIRLIEFRWIFFALAWLALSLIPTYQVWHITDTLQGSRFFYLGSAPFALLLALIALPPAHGINGSMVFKIARYAGVALLAILSWSFAVCTIKNSLPWARAGKEVRTLRQQLSALVSRLPYKEKVILLNLPQRHHGSHMLYNAAMLEVLLSPPLTEEGIQRRVITFEPVTYGDTNLIQVSRLRRLLAQGHTPYWWDSRAGQLVKLPLSTQMNPRLDLKLHTADTFRVALDRYLVSPDLHVSPLAVDFLAVTLTAKPLAEKSDQAHLLLSWRAAGDDTYKPLSRLALPLVQSTRPVTYRFAVSQYKSWIAAQEISGLALFCTHPCELSVSQASLVSGKELIPSIDADRVTLKESDSGIYTLKGGVARLEYDCSRVKGATQAVIELSRPNSWFEHYSGQLRDSSASFHALRSWFIPRLTGTFTLPAATLPQAGYYQLRVAAADQRGKVCGYFSDPIDFQVCGDEIARSQAVK